MTALAIELTHPTAGGRRVEFLTERTVLVQLDGTNSLNTGTKPGHPPRAFSAAKEDGLKVPVLRVQKSLQEELTAPGER